MRMSDWSSDVCSADLRDRHEGQCLDPAEQALEAGDLLGKAEMTVLLAEALLDLPQVGAGAEDLLIAADVEDRGLAMRVDPVEQLAETGDPFVVDRIRSEEHASELQSLMRISYAVFCLKKKQHK